MKKCILVLGCGEFQSIDQWAKSKGICFSTNARAAFHHFVTLYAKTHPAVHEFGELKSTSISQVDSVISYEGNGGPTHLYRTCYLNEVCAAFDGLEHWTMQSAFDILGSLLEEMHCMEGIQELPMDHYVTENPEQDHNWEHLIGEMCHLLELLSPITHKQLHVLFRKHPRKVATAMCLPVWMLEFLLLLAEPAVALLPAK